MISLNSEYLKDFINETDIANFEVKIKDAHQKLHSTGFNEPDFKGWMDLPISYSSEELNRIQKAADKIKKESDILIVIGIGGSYLGSRAAIEFLNSQNYNYIKKNAPDIFFTGNNISSRAVIELLEICRDKNVSLNVISKSGTTTEPGVAFRIFKEFMNNKYGESEACRRIYCTTDSSEGALRKMADKYGYESFAIPKNVGGRYSVLTAAGLLPIAVSGANINEILKGAADAREKFSAGDIRSNACYKYAALRNILYGKGKKIEIMAGYEPNMFHFLEWWKQLFGESEGKDGKGLFPDTAVFSTDLHSIGQYIQQGSKILFETTITIKKDPYNLILKEEKQNFDGLNYLAGKNMDFINKKAFEGTVLAHVSGGVPNIIINIEDTNEYNLGYLFYFFEKACAVSCYLLGVNPFDQPGVESYKNNMFALLGKPGYKLN